MEINPMKLNKYLEIFSTVFIGVALFGVSTSLHAEALLLTDIVASNEAGHNVSLLVKVTDRAPISSDIGGDIAASLLPPGVCTTRASDSIGRNTPCYVVHLWENGSLIQLVRERIIDNVGLNGWILLSYRSPQSNVSRNVRIELGNNGYYNDNSAQTYDLRVTGRPDFDSGKPYKFLYSQGDHDINVLYKNHLRTLQAQMRTADASRLRAAQRIWIADKEHDCGKAENEEGYRCRWQRTLWRIDELATQRLGSD